MSFTSFVCQLSAPICRILHWKRDSGRQLCSLGLTVTSKQAYSGFQVYSRNATGVLTSSKLKHHSAVVHLSLSLIRPLQR